MSSKDWATVTIEDICVRVTSGGTPSTRVPEYYNGSIPWLKTQEINFNRIHDTETKISDAGLKNSSAKWIPENSIIVAMYGATAGKVAINKIPLTTNQACCNLIINAKLADYNYIYYNLTSRFSEIASMAVGGAQQNLNAQVIRNLEIPLPSLLTQRRIADILSALDDKIEINHHTNVTLESITQSIFREWFVEFNFPGATGRMVESELGLIPKGWKVGSILEIAYLLSGGTPSTQIAEYWNGQIKWISAKDVSNARRTFVLDTERKISQMGVDNSSTKLLPALTTIVTARGTVGSYCILAEPMTMNQTNYGLKAKTENMDYFVFFSLGNLVAHLRQVSYGTIFDTVTTKTFEQSRIVIPPTSIVQEFDSRITSTMQNILNNLQQSATLASLRDALLPKLISGEIEV